jgi:hypothetical protein
MDRNPGFEEESLRAGTFGWRYRVCLSRLEKTANHFGWPVKLVKRAMDYAQAFPKETECCRVAETT